MLHVLGDLRLMQGEPDEAAVAFREQFRLGRELGSRHLAGLALFGLAQVAASRGKHTEAYLRAQASLGELVPVGDSWAKEVRDWVRHLGLKQAVDSETPS